MLTPQQKQALGENIFFLSACFMTAQSLGKFCQAHGIVSEVDKKELVDLLLKVTKCTRGEVTYITGDTYKCYIGVAIHPQYDAIPHHLCGVARDLRSQTGKILALSKDLIWK